MNSAEGERVQWSAATRQLRATFLFKSPPAQQSVCVEQQLPRTPAFLYSQCRQRLLLAVELHHPRQVDVAQYIHVVQQKRLVASIFKEEPCGLLQTTAGIKQLFFTRDLDAHTEILLRGEVVRDHVSKVIHV